MSWIPNPKQFLRNAGSTEHHSVGMLYRHTRLKEFCVAVQMQGVFICVDMKTDYPFVLLIQECKV